MLLKVPRRASVYRENNFFIELGFSVKWTKLRVSKTSHQLITGGKVWKKGTPEVALRKPEKLGTVRARMLNGCVVEKSFADIFRIIVNLDLQEKTEKKYGTAM